MQFTVTASGDKDRADHAVAAKVVAHANSRIEARNRERARLRVMRQRAIDQGRDDPGEVEADEEVWPSSTSRQRWTSYVKLAAKMLEANHEGQVQATANDRLDAEKRRLFLRATPQQITDFKTAVEASDTPAP